MRSSKTIHVISAHAEGEVGDVIVGGGVPPPGDTIWAQSRWIAQDQRLRNFVLNEPRGGNFRHVNLLVLGAGRADLVSIVRGQIADPYMVSKTAAGRSDDIRS